ncbi:MAG: LamG-like jellyroll fold domain-containing protein [Verrucomicrobiota bacterium]
MISAKGARLVRLILVAACGLLVATAEAALSAPPLRGNLGAHDPGTIIKCKDKYFLFYTGSGIASKSSTDKIFWAGGPNVFASPPNWTTNAAPGFTTIFWAPDIIYLNGRYCLYYAVSTFGSQVSGIGLVTNPTLDPADAAYLWTDQGPVITSTNGSPYNTIDPSVTLDASGNPWMSFGSYWNGIYMVQLDPATGLRISANSPAYRLAYNSSIEASCTFRHGGYYYLMVNWGSCCSGVNSTYNIRMGRSTNITGPYLDRNGVDMVNNGGSLFLQGTGKFTGPGHFALLAENGMQWFSYHYYDAGQYAPWYGAYGAADFDLEPLSWTADNWPAFTNDWAAVYNFQSDARDDNGQYYGLLQNGAAIQNDPLHGRVLNLNGTNQSVLLPPGVAFARTFAAVMKWNGGAAWQRLFDFGVDTSKYLMLTPLAGDTGKMRCDIRANGITQTITAPSALSTGVWTHVALTLDGQNGIIYVNGAPVVTNTVTLSPLDVEAQTNYLGRSKFVADPGFNGQIASFRVSGRALAPMEITAPQPVIDQPADGSPYWPGTTVAFRGTGTDFLDLPLASSACNWRVEYAQDGKTNIVYGPLTGITKGSFNVPTNATGGGIYRVILTATDAAGHQGVTAAALVPANPPAGWSAYYPFRADAADANGRFPGTLNGGAAIQTDAIRGKVLNLSGTNQFVTLPPGVAGMQTFMAWVKWNGGGAWQRVFDFGNNTTNYTVLTPAAANGRLRFNITLNSLAGEQIADAPSALPVGIWTHVAVTTDGRQVILYTNGVAMVTNANTDLIPANLQATHNYLGKSQWPDPYFNGQLSAVRMFSSALSPAAIVSPQIFIVQPAWGSLYHPGDQIAFNGGANDFYDSPIAVSNLTWSVQWRSNGATNSVIASLTGVTNGVFLIPGSGNAATNGFYRIFLVAADAASRKSTNYVDIFPTAAAGVNTNWASYYPFAAGAQDTSNYFNGTFSGGASLQNDASRGSVLNLSGVGQYLGLPAGIGAARTFAGWVKWRGGAMWQRIFDFGQDTQHYFFLTPYASDANMQCAITAQASAYTQVIEAPALPVNVWTHVAVALDGRQGILYVNGQAVAVNNSVNLLPADLGATRNYFGKSQFTADAYFNGQLDSVKINSQALSAAEIYAPALSITQPAAGTLYSGGLSLAFAGVATDYSDALLSPATYAWAAEFHHDGLTDPLPGPVAGATNGTLQIPTNGPASTNVFYRLYLTVADTNGNQQSASVDVLPRLGTLNLATVPPGLQLGLDSQTMTAPTSVVMVAGLTRSLLAPSSQSLSGSNYNFVVWSDGGAQTHNVIVPTNPASYTAGFVPPPLLFSNGSGALMLQWPGWAAPFSLWGTTNLASPVWSPIAGVPAATRGNLQLALPATPGSIFYRLQLP